MLDAAEPRQGKRYDPMDSKPLLGFRAYRAWGTCKSKKSKVIHSTAGVRSKDMQLGTVTKKPLNPKPNTSSEPPPRSCRRRLESDTSHRALAFLSQAIA